MGSISQAIKTQDMKMLTAVVESQIAIYGAALPDEAKAMVNTIHGDMPISMIFDDETKWAVITGEYVRIVNLVKVLPKCVDERCNAENAARKCGVFTYNAPLLERKSCKNSIFQNFSFAQREATF